MNIKFYEFSTPSQAMSAGRVPKRLCCCCCCYFTATGCCHGNPKFVIIEIKIDTDYNRMKRKDIEKTCRGVFEKSAPFVKNVGCVTITTTHKETALIMYSSAG